jgi:sensor histidine kinase regulating citrate/malate metabolism
MIGRVPFLNQNEAALRAMSATRIVAESSAIPALLRTLGQPRSAITTMTARITTETIHLFIFPIDFLHSVIKNFYFGFKKHEKQANIFVG